MDEQVHSNASPNQSTSSGQHYRVAFRPEYYLPGVDLGKIARNVEAGVAKKDDPRLAPLMFEAAEKFSRDICEALACLPEHERQKIHVDRRSIPMAIYCNPDCPEAMEMLRQLPGVAHVLRYTPVFQRLLAEMEVAQETTTTELNKESNS